MTPQERADRNLAEELQNEAKMMLIRFNSFMPWDDLDIQMQTSDNILVKRNKIFENSTILDSKFHTSARSEVKSQTKKG